MLKNTKLVAVHLCRTTLERLKVEAEFDGSSVSYLVRKCVEAEYGSAHKPNLRVALDEERRRIVLEDAKLIASSLAPPTEPSPGATGGYCCGCKEPFRTVDGKEWRCKCARRNPVLG